MEDKKKWLIEWFVKNVKANGEKLAADSQVNYFNAGYINSFNFINLISDIEDEFDISFDNSQFLDKSFSTIDGLAAIIERLAGK